MHRVCTRLLPKHFGVRTLFGRALAPRHVFEVDPWTEMHRTIDQMQNEPVPFSNWVRPWRAWSGEHPVDVELYRCANPIVDENGKKMFKLEFDVRRFQPSEVHVKTKNNVLTVHAKHETKDDHSTIAMYELHRELVIPDGVKADEVMCEYTHEGMLQLTAPYTPPKATDKTLATPAKAETIQVKHE